MVAGVAVLAAAAGSWSQQMLGFPDGHLTEVDRVDETLLTVFVTMSAATAVVSTMLGVTAKRLNAVRLIAIGWVALGVVLLALHLVAASTLESGGGG
ncbi:MAG: hypothetical protein Q8S33_11780 [Myxococcales bacterium]|nr:hypothetical protein [Myxococcales bacterium]MDP3501011.1 hypothetical protein [Myxococcales bacterium]